jgi:MFS transporter, SP family, arabinose:H+ symporter
VVFGIMLAYMSNYVIRTMHLGATEWRWQVGVAGVPAVAFLILLFSIPRSPRWSASRDRIDEALAVLRQMGEPNPEGELADIRSALAEEHATVHERVFKKKYRFPLFLAISIGAFNQLAGINAILYYINDIFAYAGFTQLSGDQKAIAIGATNVVFTMIAMSVIDKLGRKALLLVGAAGMSTCLGGVAWIFSSHTHQGALVWILITYMAFFAFSQGAVIWVYIGEVFPTSVRSKGQGVGSGSHWFMNAAIAMAFPVVVTSMSTATPFIFFSIMTVIQFFTVLFTYPETKGQSLEDLQRKLVRADS